MDFVFCCVLVLKIFLFHVNYNEEMQNIEIPKTKEIFKVRFSELLANSRNKKNGIKQKENNESENIYFLNFLKEWVENLYDNLTNKMNCLKQIKIFNKPEITNYLSSLVIDLEKYFNSEINSVLDRNTQFENFGKIKENFSLMKKILYNTYKNKKEISTYGNLKVLEKKLNLIMNGSKDFNDKNLNKFNENKNLKEEKNLFEENDNVNKKVFSASLFSIINENYEKYLELKDNQLLKSIYEDYKKDNIHIINNNVQKMKIVYKIFNYLNPIDNI